MEEEPLLRTLTVEEEKLVVAAVRRISEIPPIPLPRNNETEFRRKDGRNEEIKVLVNEKIGAEDSCLRQIFPIIDNAI